jgi:hypothetical protein
MEITPTPLEVDEIKTILGWQGTDSDDYLTTMIPLLVDHVTEYCNNPLGQNQTPPARLPGGVILFIAKACEHNKQKAGLKSRTMGSVSYSYDLEFPSALMTYLRPYRKVKFHASR